MVNLAELLRLLHNLIRLGTVDEVDVAAARARVQSGDNLTDWLPWLSARAGSTRDWDPPTVGEQVLLLSPGGDLAQAIILTGIYSDANPPPATSADLWCRTFPDGTRLEYDHAASRLTLDVVGAADLNIGGDATVTVGGTAAITAGAEATVDAPAIKLNKGAGVVTGAHICHFTGTPHGDVSTTVTAGK